MSPFVKLARKPMKEGVKIARMMCRLEEAGGGGELAVCKVVVWVFESGNGVGCWVDGVCLGRSKSSVAAMEVVVVLILLFEMYGITGEYEGACLL